MNKKFELISLIFSFFFCLVASAVGQETTGNIEGYVKDSSGAVVPSVAVTIRSFKGTTDASGTTTIGTSQGFRRTVTSDSNGFFRVLQVPPGVYVVSTAAANGFGEARYENVQVVLGKTTQLEIAVTPGEASAVVDVSVSDQPVDTTDNEVSTSLNAQKMELIPKGVDFTSILKASPGTRPEPASGGFSVDGASGAENVFIIDGQEVTNYRTGTLNGNNAIPFQMVQEVQVKSSGFDAEFGGATGGVINVVTKGGNNDFRGEFGLQFVTSKLNGNPRPVLSRFISGSGAAFTQTIEKIQMPKPNYTNTFPTANLSGPVIKDKLWFFSSYSPQIFDEIVPTTFYTNAPAATRTITATDEYRRKRTYEYAFTRLDAQPFSKVRLTGTYLWNPIIDEGALPFTSGTNLATTNNPGTITFSSDPAVNFGGNIGTLQGSALRNRQGGRQNSNNLTGQAVYTPLNNLVLSFRFSRGFLNEKLGNYFIPTGIRYICAVGNTPTNFISPDACTQGVNDPVNDITIKDVSVRTNYEADATSLFNFGGRHEIKVGFQRFKIFNDLDKNSTTRVYLEFGADETIQNMTNWQSPATPTPQDGTRIGAGNLYRYAERGTGSNLNQSLYVQDKWQPFRRLTLNLGVRLEKEDLPSFNNLAPPINFGWTDKIAPRLGFAYDLFGNGKSKVFGSYGKFYDRLKFSLPQGSFGGNFYRVDFFEIFAGGGGFRSYTPARILGNYADPIGGACPQTGFIGSGISRCQFDYRVPSNAPGFSLEEAGGVDPDLKPFSQTEFTVGLEHQFARNYVLRGRYTSKRLNNAVEDAGVISPTGSEIYIIANPGQGLHEEFLKQFGYEGPYAKPVRNYDAMELVLEKRLSNNFYFNLNYTLSRLYGNYSGLANSDEVSTTTGQGRLSLGGNRSFDLPHIGFTAAGGQDLGRLPTDRPHIFNAYGAYIFDWRGSKTNSTELSFFQTVQSGAPVTSQIGFITTTIFKGRGDMGRTPTFSQTDFNISHRYRFGRDNRFTLVGDLNILNLWEQKTVTGYWTLLTAAGVNYPSFPQYQQGGYPALINAYNRGELLQQINTFLAGTPTVLNRKDDRYGQPLFYQLPRNVRFGFRLIF